MSKVSFEFEGSKLKIGADINEDGQPSVAIVIDLAEIPEEVLAAIAAVKK